MKGIIQSMGANKTEKAIGRASKASSGVRRIVEAFDCQVGISPSSSSRNHSSSDEDEKKICEDLRLVRPFEYTKERQSKSLKGINSDGCSELDKSKFKEWFARHKKYDHALSLPCR